MSAKAQSLNEVVTAPAGAALRQDTTFGQPFQKGLDFTVGLSSSQKYFASKIFSGALLGGWIEPKGLKTEGSGYNRRKKYLLASIFFSKVKTKTCFCYIFAESAMRLRPCAAACRLPPASSRRMIKKPPEKILLAKYFWEEERPTIKSSPLGKG